MNKEFERLEIIIGEKNLSLLSRRHVAIFGIGGVGSYAAEAITRSGVGTLTLVDYDSVDITNINRQIPALHSNLGKKKVEILKERYLDINPELKINTKDEKFDENTDDSIFQNIDYIVDSIDDVKNKTLLIRKAYQKNIPIISSMGMGNKLNPLNIKVARLDKTHTCPLAKIMRKELKKYNIIDIKCVFSTENPIINHKKTDENGKLILGSSAFVPSVAGLIIASEVIKDLIYL